MAEKRKRGRWYWHCHACGRYVPRDQKECACGADKQHVPRSEAKGRTLRGAGGLAFGIGVVLLWLVLLWMVLREHTPPPAPQRRRGALEAPALMTQPSLDSLGRRAHTPA
ncbi:MAG TPA: hypothetical protein VFM88_16205 [Vicinamibacteria bacterium]|nr:hypothetical protein [Vicinamibacteria bacterium]